MSSGPFSPGESGLFSCFTSTMVLGGSAVGVAVGAGDGDGVGVKVGVAVGIMMGDLIGGTGVIIASLEFFTELQGNLTTKTTLLLAKVVNGRKMETRKISVTNPSAMKNFSLPAIIPRYQEWLLFVKRVYISG